jgi:hypothetical protein
MLSWMCNPCSQNQLTDLWELKRRKCVLLAFGLWTPEVTPQSFGLIEHAETQLSVGHQD